MNLLFVKLPRVIITTFLLFSGLIFFSQFFFIQHIRLDFATNFVSKGHIEYQIKALYQHLVLLHLNLFYGMLAFSGQKFLWP